MGYKREPKLYRLKFADGDFEGLEVTLRGLNTGQFLEMSKLAKSVSADKANVDMDAAELMFRNVAHALVEWNLEDWNGDPVPATYEGVTSQDLDLNMKIITEWVGAMAAVDTPLPVGSSSGAISPEASLPMEPL